jgi:hypothetical protein
VAVDYGFDLAGVSDLDPSGAEISGRRLLAECLARRLTTPRGSCIDAPDDCIDLRDYLNLEVDTRTIGQLGATITSECLKDERVVGVDIEEASIANNVVTVRIAIEDGEGPFSLTLSVGEVDISLLIGS